MGSTPHLMAFEWRTWFLINGFKYFTGTTNSKPSSSSLQRRSSSPEATHFLGSQVLFLALQLHRGVPLCALDGFGHADGLRQRVLNDDFSGDFPHSPIEWGCLIIGGWDYNITFFWMLLGFNDKITPFSEWWMVVGISWVITCNKGWILHPSSLVVLAQWRIVERRAGSASRRTGRCGTRRPAHTSPSKTQADHGGPGQNGSFWPTKTGWWLSHLLGKYEFVSWGYYLFPIYGKI
jgi:hypothetical protein